MAGPRDRGFSFDGSANNFNGVVFIGPVNVLGGHHTMETTTGTPIGLRSNLLVQVAEGARLETQIPFAGNAGILKSGPGAFIFNDASNTYTGLTLVQEGVFGGSGVLAGDLFVEKGAKLLFDPGNSLTVKGKTSFGGFLLQDLVGLDRNSPVGTYTLIHGAVDPANIANLGPDKARDLGRGRFAHFEVDESSLRLVVENRSRRDR
jgi:autotransporter-associated beta strand protein